MHEFSMVQALLQRVRELAQQQRPGRVRFVRVQIGEFSGVDPDLLQSAFADSVAGTDLAQVELRITCLALTAACRSCAHEFMVDQFSFVCPRCQVTQVDIVRGDEFVLESL